MSASIEGFFLKIHTSHTTRMYKNGLILVVFGG